jgi:eukaryotic-like serine/threonine-protein kinase
MQASIGTECPEPAQLRRLINGSLSHEEQVQLTAHLDSCESCQQAIEHIAAGGSGLLDCVSRSKDVRPDDTSAYWPALRKLEREVLKPPVMAATLAHVDGTYPDVSLDFLDPAQEPGTLGKLGRFHVVEVIGQGGMGLVLRGLDVCLQRQVALKVLDPRYVKNDLARNRFIREARAAASIAHENVVAVHHVEMHREEVPFLVMRLVAGESLQDRLDASKGPLDIREVVRIGRQLASGLAAAHEQTLIHRDIKPANILIEAVTGRVLLTDFGLARATEDVKLTQTGFVAGTPLYMSPEQARGEPLDNRSDLFSLGSVLYALCAGAPPFQGSSPFVVLRAVTEDNHRALHELNPQVPEELAAVIDRLLAKKPDDRIQSAAEVADLLAAIEARLPALPEMASPRVRPTRRLPAAGSRNWLNRNGLWIAAAVFGLNLLVLLTEWAKLTHWTILGQRGQAAAPIELPAQKAVIPGPIDNQPQPHALFDAGIGPIWSIAASPDGALLAAALDDGTIRLWDAKAGKLKSRIAGHKGPIRSIAFNHDGTMFASAGDDGFVKLWDPTTSKDIDWIELRVPVHAIAFSPDGSRIATGDGNGAVRVWDALTRKNQVVTQDRHSRFVTALAFSADGKCLASAGDDRAIKIWDLSDDEGRELNTFADHVGSIHTIAFHPQRKLVASGGWDRNIRLWDIDQGKLVGKLEGHQGDVWSIAFTADGSRLVSASDDRTIRTWDVAAAKEIDSFVGHAGAIHGVVLTDRDAALFTAGRDGLVKQWDLTK